MTSASFVLRLANTQIYVFSAENGSMSTTSDWGHAKRFASIDEFMDFIENHCPKGYAFEPMDVGYRMDKYDAIENA